MEKALQQKDAVFIDTRTPNEFNDDAIPRAVNIPIFSNEERAVVGTIYKQVSREKAIAVGIEFFSQKMPHFMAEINQYRNTELIIYCWRGGMRSRTVTALLESLGYNVKQMVGGYKEYRAYIRKKLDTYSFKPKIIVLWGLTCTGKTELVQQFDNGLDLEGLAQHRGSLYGSIGLTPRSQKKFENLLYWELEKLKPEKHIIVEGESRKIGNVQIPGFFYQRMMKGTHLLITRSLDSRAAYAVQQYFGGAESIRQIREITLGLRKVISNEHRKFVAQHLDGGEYQEAAKILLQYYYDPLYEHTLKKLTFSTTVENEDLKKAVAEIQKIMVQEN